MKNYILILSSFFMFGGCVVMQSGFRSELSVNNVDGGQNLSVMIHAMGVDRQGEIVSVRVISWNEDGSDTKVTNVPIDIINSKDARCEFNQIGAVKRNYIVEISTANSVYINCYPSNLLCK